MLAQAFREWDRHMNRERYPELNFRSLFILEGGYRRFYRECPDLCDGGYVTMRDERFVRNGSLKKNFARYSLARKPVKMHFIVRAWSDPNVGAAEERPQATELPDAS
jgi:hypothetical protein